MLIFKVLLDPGRTAGEDIRLELRDKNRNEVTLILEIALVMPYHLSARGLIFSAELCCTRLTSLETG